MVLFEEVKDIVEWKRMLGAQREHNGVVGRRRPAVRN